jgi:SpoIID/LytB domain protein
VFRGKGFGHGLCQEGAHAMARGGASYRQILSQYFPGTSTVGKEMARR